MAAWLILMMSMMLFAAPAAVGQIHSYNTSVRIDCGGSANFTNEFNEVWLSDRFYSGGEAATVSEPDGLTRLQERTVRYFPLSNGKKNCYIVGVPKGRYYIRMFFIYNNYDHKSQTPNFDVSIEGTVVFSWRYPWSQVDADMGVYSDILAYIEDNDATICFYSIATDSPVVGALEIVQVDPFSYSAYETGTDMILVNYGRFTGGPSSFGTGVSHDVDRGGRAWQSDANFTYSSSPTYYISTQNSIKNANTAPNHFPERLYQTAHSLMSPSSIEYLFTVDSSLDYMIWFHFAEIDNAVHSSGQRVFDIYVNNQVAIASVDVYQAVGKFTAYDLVYNIKNLTGSALNITLAPLTGSPMLNGFENYALLPVDLSTNRTQVMAMRALKQSLQVPQRMGWNGDPCAPYNWDTWEGVTCNPSSDKKLLVVTHLDLSGQGLKGNISENISFLTDLLTLNLSNNDIKGSIPAGIGNHKLTTVDLSMNQLTGLIPDSLGKPQLVKVILNNNQLSGQVPLSLYSIGVRGGFINISSNGALCGVPALAECSYFWDSDKGMSKGAKVGISLSVVVTAAIAVTLVALYIRKKRKDDYNFGLPHQLASRSMRYQKQKSKLSEAEHDQYHHQHQSSKFGFASNLNPL